MWQFYFLRGEKKVSAVLWHRINPCAYHYKIMVCPPGVCRLLDVNNFSSYRKQTGLHLTRKKNPTMGEKPEFMKQACFFVLIIRYSSCDPLDISF